MLSGAESVKVDSRVSAAVSVITPTFGPAMVTIFGLDIPVMAFGLSMVGLLLARTIAPVSRRKLNKKQEGALTVLLVIVLLMIVSGQFGNGTMGAGMAVVWGIGLGMSGLLVIEFFGNAIMDLLRRIVGVNPSASE